MESKAGRIRLGLAAGVGIVTLLAVVMAGCGGSDSSSGGGAPEGTLKIGVLAPVTGFMAGHGIGIRDGAKLAAAEINAAGGILDRQIELVIEDGKSDPAVNTEKAKQLIGRNGVDVLMGTGSSAETLAAVTVATQNKVPFIYSIDGENKTCAPGDAASVNPYVFAAGPTPEMLLASFLPAMMKAHGKRIYYVGSDYVFPRSLNAVATKITREEGGTVLADNYLPTETTDYAPEIRKVLAAKPDILFLALPGSAGITFVKQARQFGVFEQMTVTGSATFDTEAYGAIGKLSTGVLVVNRYSELLENEANAKFVKAFREAYPDFNDPIGPTAAAGAYGTVYAFKAAIEKAGSTDADAIVEALEGLTLDLPQGQVTVNPETHVFDQPLYVMEIREGNYQVVQDLGVQRHPGFVGCSVT
jgi:ABC-type branched-subunit amino acid transport system substrate-binding protein